MTDRILLAIAAFCALVCALGLLRLISFQSRRYCPGLRLRGREWLLPFNWLSSIGCGYDLTGHLQYTKHALPITCSECGRAIERRRQMRRRPRRWRMVTVGGLGALGFSFALVQRFFAQTHWDDDLPTWALIAIHDWCGDSTPVGVREELRRRRSEMTDAQVMALFPMFISDLRSDAVMWNAGSAAYLLQKSDSPQLQDALREALDSEDWQQRQYAAQILHQREAAPTFELIRVSLEALRYDATRHYRLDSENVESAYTYLRAHAEASRGVLRAVLHSQDVQQQQVAARILMDMDEPPTPAMLHALVVGFTRPDGRFEREVRDMLFDDGIPRLVDYFGRHGPVARDFLRSCLRLDEGTARTLAACILRELSAEIDDELLAALVDGLRHDPWRKHDYGDHALLRFVIRDTMDRLVEMGPAATEALRRGMRSSDPQQRLLCASVAGFARLHELLGDAVPVLIEHLRSNRIGDDAVFATRALAGYGSGARPWLEEAANGSDAQAGFIAVYLLDRLISVSARLPEQGWSSTMEEQRFWLTSRTDDPARLDWRKLEIPRIDPDRVARR